MFLQFLCLDAYSGLVEMLPADRINGTRLKAKKRYNHRPCAVSPAPFPCTINSPATNDPHPATRHQRSEDRGQRTDIPVSNRHALCTIPYALCPMPINPHPATPLILLRLSLSDVLLYALCPMLYALFSRNPHPAPRNAPYSHPWSCHFLKLSSLATSFSRCSGVRVL
jgi:hypothetical protein